MHVFTDTALKLIAAELQAENPAQMAVRWAQVIGRPAALDQDVWLIRLDEGEIRFVGDLDGRGEGLGAFDILFRDIDAVHANAAARGLLSSEGTLMLAGTRVRLIEP